MKSDPVGAPEAAVDVTPFTGVWIEIASSVFGTSQLTVSHPSRVCGLK